MAYTEIDDPSAYFQNKIYSGTGSSLALTFDGNSDMQPDWVWFKRRNASANHHAYDSVRGVTAALVPNDTDRETTGSLEATNYFTSFNSNGFTLAGGGYSNSNASGGTYVSWNWKAGTSFTNDASATGIGSIDSSGSVNTTAGFSIVSYTGNGSAGATVAHGLGSAANLLIVKKRSSTAQWVFGSTALDSSWDNFLFLDSTSAKGNADNVFNDTAPTSSVFSIGNAGDTNASSETYICYAFAEKKGYSKFGSYVGNGNADGTFVYTGFKPALVIRKVTDASSDWIMQDNKRSESGGSNMIRNYLFPNSSQAEVSSQDYFNIDFLSNGFKMRSTDGGANGSGNNYIFMAFAENPFVTSTGVPATAR